MVFIKLKHRNIVAPVVLNHAFVFHCLKELVMQPVLMILTSHTQLGNTGKLTGLWAEELTTPYYALVDAGFDVTLASPLGGTPPWVADSLQVKPEDTGSTVTRFLADPVAIGKFNATHKTADLQAANYSAVFLPGGHGTMWDTATDNATARLVADSFNAGKPTAAVCHGPAGLVKALRTDGKSILFGRKVNGFTNAEETAAGLMEVVPFHLETKMRELGGVFESGPNWAPYAVRDGNLITGQNPASSALVASYVVAALQGK
jgi:putative intracellular protease/amidase